MKRMRRKFKAMQRGPDDKKADWRTLYNESKAAGKVAKTEKKKKKYDKEQKKREDEKAKRCVWCTTMIL